MTTYFIRLNRRDSLEKGDSPVLNHSPSGPSWSLPKTRGIETRTDRDRVGAENSCFGPDLELREDESERREGRHYYPYRRNFPLGLIDREREQSLNPSTRLPCPSLLGPPLSPPFDKTSRPSKPTDLQRVVTDSRS